MSKSSGEMSTAFLDVLSCSLGGMILLFLIFATLEHRGDRTSHAREGIERKSRRLRPARDLGLEEVKFPVVVELRLESLDGTPVDQVGVTCEDPGDPAWADISRDPDDPALWYVMVLDPASADQGAILLTPESHRFRVSSGPITGFRSESSDAVVAKAVTAGTARLRFSTDTFVVPVSMTAR